MIFAMLPFVIYFVTGVITGFHVYTLLALTVYGVPFNPLELLSLLGSLGLLIAAYVSLYKPRAAARIALLAALAIWSLYGPAIARSLRTRFDKQSSVAQTNGFRSGSR
jgi:phosphoglycerol transferase MdoB-like AlkP superfamily enzyme